MLSKLRTRLTFANVVSALALFVALGGSSYAAITLKRNSVKGKHISANAVTSPKVKDRSLLAQDFAPGQLPRGERGVQGERGQGGPPGPPGPFPSTAPSGQTLTGAWHVQGMNEDSTSGDVIGNSISFALPLSAAPAVTIVPAGGPATANCPGTDTSPSALPGNLCVYVTATLNALAIETLAPGAVSPGSSSRFGTGLRVLNSSASANTTYRGAGTWAVTAP